MSRAHVVLITGGSRGIGAAVAVSAARQGYDIAISYQSNKSAADKVATQVRGLGRRVLIMQADASDEQQIMRLYEQIDCELGPLHGLVNNAGIVAPPQAFADYSLERLQRMFGTNILGTFIAAREAVRRMSTDRGGNGGSIVNVSSVAARLGAPNEYIDYAASKGAMDSMTLGLSKELAGQGIRVNAVRPGLIYTDIHASGGRPNRVDDLAHGVPMQRGGSAQEVANAILWLLSEQSSYVTGTFIDVAGGR